MQYGRNEIKDTQWQTRENKSHEYMDRYRSKQQGGKRSCQIFFLKTPLPFFFG